MSPELYARLLSVAEELADVARAPALSAFRSLGLGVDNKLAEAGAFDPVTRADRETEIALRERLRALRPQDAILGEEFGAAPGESPRDGDGGLTWVLDPIDGTRAYLCGAPTWGVLIALNDGEGPILGVMDQPFTGERFVGAPRRIDGGPAAYWRRGDESRPLRTRPCAALSQATLLSTFPEVGSAADRAGFEAVRDRVRLTRYGLDCYGYAMVAMGCADLVIEAGLQPYDIQALRPIVEGAGGVVTDWRGGRCDHGGRVLAAGDPALHAQALAALAGY
jgi:histidinol phosphatase-like enzyme (inositol monophosphatase family)